MIDKRNAAVECLDVALRAYLDDGDHFAAAVLAHTAGDPFDSMLQAHGAQTGLDELVAGTKELQGQFFGEEPKDSTVRRLDREPRNAAKHMDVNGLGDWSDRPYRYDVEQAAFDAIDLALDDLDRLLRIESFEVSELVQRWDRERPVRPQKS
jgi:hypothetical protein